MFSFLFFFMLYVLGVGSNVAMASSVITVFRDKYPQLKGWVAATCVAIFGFSVGIVYVTPVSSACFFTKKKIIEFMVLSIQSMA